MPQGFPGELWLQEQPDQREHPWSPNSNCCLSLLWVFPVSFVRQQLSHQYAILSYKASVPKQKSLYVLRDRNHRPRGSKIKGPRRCNHRCLMTLASPSTEPESPHKKQLPGHTLAPGTASGARGAQEGCSADFRLQRILSRTFHPLLP